MKTRFVFIFLLLIVGCNRLEVASERSIEIPHELSTKGAITQRSDSLAIESAISMVQSFDMSLRRGQPRVISGVEYSENLRDSKEGIVLSSPVYVINFKDDEGFAIASSNGDLPPVLCIVDTGHYHVGEELPLGAVAMLSRAEDSFKLLKRRSGKGQNEPWYDFPQDSVYTIWSTLSIGNVHGTRLVCEWGQSPRFNNQCPYLPNGDRALVGCVPVAVGQIMYYHGKNATYGGKYYNWDIMHLIQNVDSCPMYAIGWLDVGAFLHALGDYDNLRASYETTGTSANQYRAPETFLNFGYKSGGVFTDFNYWNLSYDIVHGYPVHLSAKRNMIVHSNTKSQPDTSYFSGHSWVADQFVSVLRRVKVYNKYTWDLLYTADVNQKYIHCNWGWNGSFNGFFLSEDFDYTKPLYIPTKSQPDTLTGTAYKYLLELNSGIRP